MKNRLINKIICILYCACYICCSSNNIESRSSQKSESNIESILNQIVNDEQFDLFCKKFHVKSVNLLVDNMVCPDSNNNIIIKNIPAITSASREKINMNLSIVEFVSNVYLVEIKIPYENAHLNYVVENANDSILILGYRMYEI